MPEALDPRALAGHDPDAAVVTLAGETMGTNWRVLAAGVDPAPTEAAIAARLAAINAEMSHWDAGSLLSRFNRMEAGAWMSLPPDFARVMAAGLRIAEDSGGAVDPAIGRLVDLWGFGPPGAMPEPDDAAVAAALATSEWRRLGWDPAARRIGQPGGLALDLSGIAKGFAVDAVADLLERRGCRHCLVEIGGELAGRGIRPDGDPWWVDLEPPPGVANVPLRLALCQAGVATSGVYRRGEHNLDPRTGRPAEAGVISVSVVAGSAMEADAWATALSVEPALGEANGLAARFVMRDGAEVMTPAMRRMLVG